MSLFRKIIAGTAALAASAVAACDQAPTSRVTYMRPGGVYDLMASATARGPLLVETVNSPFEDFRPQAVAELVSLAVKAGVAGRVISVTTQPAESSLPAYRVRVALDAPANASPQALCLGEAPEVVSGGDRLTVLMVFCSKGDLEASVVGHIPRPEDPTAEAFGKLLRQMTRQMFADSPARS